MIEASIGASFLLLAVLRFTVNSQIVITIECDPALPHGTKLMVKHHIEEIETNAVEKSPMRKAVRPHKAKRFLETYEEAAEYSAMTVDMLKRRVASRAISVIKYSHNKVAFDPAELDEYVKKHRIKSLLR